MRLFIISLFLFFHATDAHAQTHKIVKPSKAQLQWHEQEFYLFTHFGPNTYTDLEWGHGNEAEDIFNPIDLDCNQWADIAKAAGATGIIITAKHHDGFCLWPSNFSKHTVRESKWRDGKGDVLKELSAACKSHGLKFGVYISPWDRNHPAYGTAEYNTVFVNMMKELFTNYGPIWELWWDGANGEGPNGKKQIYDWNLFKKTVHELSPKTVVFSDIGPQLRWVGNEKGIASMTNWNTLNIKGFTPGAGAPAQSVLGTGNVNGSDWIPAECDVSIRPGWFYHRNEDEKVKSPEQLFELYLKSVGRGANFLLNVPPDPRGKIHSNDSAALVGFQLLKKSNFENEISISGSFKKISRNKFSLVWKNPQEINTIVLAEKIKNGQSISAFKLNLYQAENIVKIIEGTTVGRKRIITFPLLKIDKIELELQDLYQRVNLKSLKAFHITEALVEKT
ncbi:MAG: alpha-L-fucosidase [Saprospiraceae bacterium]